MNYINDADALEKADAIIRAIRWELFNYQRVYNQQKGTNINVVAAWDAWFKDFMTQGMRAAATFINTWASTGLENFEDSIDPDNIQATRDLASYVESSRISMDSASFNDLTYPVGDPTSLTTP